MSITETPAPKKERKVRPQRQDTLWVTDEEMYQRLGVPEKVGRPAVALLDRNRANGFPQKSLVWGGRRYWPAVKAWFEKHHERKIDAPPEIRRVS